MAHSTKPTSDQGAAFTGLLVTAAALFVMVLGIVTWTNSKYAGEKAGAAAEAKH